MLAYLHFIYGFCIPTLHYTCISYFTLMISIFGKEKLIVKGKLKSISHHLSTATYLSWYLSSFYMT